MMLTVDFISSINLRCSPDSETRCHDIEDIAIEAGFRQQHDNAIVLSNFSYKFSEILVIILYNMQK